MRKGRGSGHRAVEPVSLAGDGAGDIALGMAAEEAEILARIVAGDREAGLRELYRRYERRLHGLGLRLLSDPSLAEELVQETFLRLWRSASRFDPQRGSVAAFIFSIARRIAIDLWRRPSSRPFEAVGDPAGPPAGDGIEKMLVALTVRDGLHALSSAHREVLELSYARGLKQSEIAEILHLPLGTVKTRTYHALRSLRLALEERGICA